MHQWRRIGARRFAAACEPRERRPGLVTYTTAGDPDLPRSAEILRALDRAGADVLEVGVPFSDPLADGPVIQRATERALAAGGSLRGVARPGRAACAPTCRRRSSSSATPTRCCGWAWSAFARRAAGGRRRRRAGARPADRGGRRVPRDARGAGIDTIFLLSPTTTDARIRKAAALGRGFLYGISRLGVTGARDRWRPAPRRMVRRIRAAHAAAGRARVRHLDAGARRRGRRVCRRGRRRQRARVASSPRPAVARISSNGSRRTFAGSKAQRPRSRGTR